MNTDNFYIKFSPSLKDNFINFFSNSIIHISVIISLSLINTILKHTKGKGLGNVHEEMTIEYLQCFLGAERDIKQARTQYTQCLQWLLQQF